MCGRYVITSPVSKTDKLVKSAIQVEDNENYNAHPYQKLPVIKKYKNGNTLENLKIFRLYKQKINFNYSRILNH